MWTRNSNVAATASAAEPVLRQRRARTRGRRLQHLCAVSGAGGTCHGLGARLPCKPFAALGQPGEERRCPCRVMQIPRLPVGRGRHPRHRAEKPSARQGAPSSDHQTQPAVSLGQMIGEANAYKTGWLTYFHHAQAHSELRGLAGWLCRKLRLLCGSSSASSPRDCGGSCANTSLAVTSPRAGVLRPRVVMPSQFAAGEDRHEYRLVRPTRIAQPDSSPCRAQRSGKPPRYVARTPGGVRRGGPVRNLPTRWISVAYLDEASGRGILSQALRWRGRSAPRRHGASALR